MSTAPIYESVDVRSLFWVISLRSEERSTPGLKGLYEKKFFLSKAQIFRDIGENPLINYQISIITTVHFTAKKIILFSR